jgi:NAD(P)-dependent dehydrogenase (short-subunit alcohol dehydrogenase family)
VRERLEIRVHAGLMAYSTTKRAIQNFTGGFAQLLAQKGIRANGVTGADLDAADSIAYEAGAG